MIYIEKRGKFGGCFGSYGWSGEGVDMIQDRLKSLKFRTPIEPLKTKLIPTSTELEQCKDFGFDFGEILNGKMVEMDI